MAKRMRRAYLKRWTGPPRNTGPMPLFLREAQGRLHSHNETYNAWRAKKDARIDRLLSKLFPQAFVRHLQPRREPMPEDHVDHKILNWMKIRGLQDEDECPKVDNMIIVRQTSNRIVTMWWASGDRRVSFIKVNHGVIYLSGEYPDKNTAWQSYRLGNIAWTNVFAISELPD